MQCSIQRDCLVASGVLVVLDGCARESATDNSRAAPV
jgi:hypothetical protein